MAWQRAKAAGTHWVEELYGRRPQIITANIARLTMELMVEQGRQEEMARKKVEGKHFFPDAELQAAEPHLYYWMRRGKIGVKF